MLASQVPRQVLDRHRTRSGFRMGGSHRLPQFGRVATGERTNFVLWLSPVLRTPGSL